MYSSPCLFYDLANYFTAFSFREDSLTTSLFHRTDARNGKDDAFRCIAPCSGPSSGAIAELASQLANEATCLCLLHGKGTLQPGRPSDPSAEGLCRLLNPRSGSPRVPAEPFPFPPLLPFPGWGSDKAWATSWLALPSGLLTRGYTLPSSNHPCIWKHPVADPSALGAYSQMRDRNAQLGSPRRTEVGGKRH